MKRRTYGAFYLKIKMIEKIEPQLSQEGPALLKERREREDQSGKGPTRSEPRQSDNDGNAKSVPGFEKRSNPFK